MPMYSRVSGTWRTIKHVHVNQSGWKEVYRGYTRVSGTWRLCHWQIRGYFYHRLLSNGSTQFSGDGFYYAQVHELDVYDMNNNQILEKHINNNHSDSSYMGTVTASSQYSVHHRPRKVKDNDYTSGDGFWSSINRTSSTNEWLRIHWYHIIVERRMRVKALRIRPRNHSTAYICTLRNITFQGSDNGTNWTTLKTGMFPSWSNTNSVYELAYNLNLPG